jgi:hypothetical protein
MNLRRGEKIEVTLCAVEIGTWLPTDRNAGTFQIGISKT